ncbi:MAG: M43 family zinc metalloprotease [Saprospiraceae bacterium]
MRNLFLLFIALFLAGNALHAQQRACGAMEVLDRQLQEDPGMLDRMNDIERFTEQFIAQNGTQNRAVVTIPVVVHVVWNTTAEKLTTAQVQSQIDVLNADFRRLNADKVNTPSEFAVVAADVEINFCLATQDPNGNATTGIVYRETAVTSFSTNDNVKFYSSGGSDIWNRDKYLNIWSCDLTGSLLGYAQFPGGSASTDGVVCDYLYFGTIGAQSPFDKGRTATHEVGHWFNLRHIWGDATCGNDFVSDTPLHNASNGGCPVYPHKSTCQGQPNEMTMNYMDYTNDACMNMFSAGQKTRMQALFGNGGARAALLTSNGCQPPAGGSCGTPGNLNATNITQTSATLNWGSVGGATSYNLQWRIAGGTWNTVTGLTGTSYSLTGLTINTTYNFQVQAKCGANTGAYSAAASFTTASNCIEQYEPNNTGGTSKVIAVNTNITAQISYNNDYDWYKFANTNSQRNIKIDLTTLPADYDVQLYRGSTYLAISENGGTNNEQIIFNTNTVSTNYRVYVYGFDGVFNNTQCYTLRASISSSNWRTDGSTDGEVTEMDIPVEMVETDLFTMSPNPAQSQVNIDLLTKTGADVQVSLFNAAGILAQQQNQAVTKGHNRIALDLAGLPAGLYIVRVQNGERVSTKKLVVE